MASLLDVAKEMQKTEQTAVTGSGALTLADVARDQSQAASPPVWMTLVDVARQQRSPNTSEPNKPALLSSLARQIDAEDTARVAATIETTATEVKSFQHETRRLAVAQAMQQVVKDEESAVAVIQSAVTASRASKPSSNNVVDDDGYSSFEDEDIAKASTSKKHADSDGGDGEEEDAGPERTTPSDSNESKEFLRAVFRADKPRIRELLDSGDVDANTADQHGWSALHWAASQTHADVLASLLSKGARVNLVDHMNGWAPLHVAAVRGAVSCAKLLMDAGADPQIVDLYGDSPVDIAAAARGKQRVQLLELLHRGRQ